MDEIQILNNGDTLYDIRRKINENFELVQTEVEEVVVDPLAKFGINEGNVTDGVADLLTVTDNTLSFKVGGEYPNLVMTSGDGVTTEIESVNNLHLQNLADGEYKILVNGEASQVSSSEFYSQLTEPQNINNGDVWFNGESTKQYLTDAPSVTPITPKTTINYKCMGNIGDLYIAAGGGQYFYISRDAGTTWESRVLPANVSGFLSCVVKDGYFYFATSTSSIMRTAEGEDPQVHHKFAETFYPQKLRLINDLFFLTATGPTLSTSADAKTWTTVTIGTQPIIDVLFIDSLYYAISRDGIIYTSSDLSAWTQLNKIEQSTGIQCVKVYKNNIILGGISGTLFIYSLENNTFTIKNIGSSEVILDMQVRPNGAMIFVGSNNMCKITYDFTTYQNLYTSGGYLEHIYKDFIMGQAGSFLRINQTVQWFDYPWVPVGEVTISGGQVTYVFTYPYNSNGLHEASSSTFGLLRTAAVTDEMNCNCNDAVITPANLYDLNNYRMANTSYQVDDKVGCPYHHNLQLKCTKAGTTSNEALDTKGELKVGSTITDGSVVWTVDELGATNGLANTDLSNLSTTGESKLTNLVKDKADKSSLAKVATSGSYNDLTNKPAQYVLPTASETGLGGVKIDGQTIKINDGVISATVKPHELFDTVIKDHILTYEESKGLALQGTYVYKTAVAGSRYGYPDFYNKCLEEYNEATESIDFNFSQPILSSNGTLGGDSFAISGTSTSSAYPAFNAFDNNKSTDWVSASANEDLIIYNPTPIKITRIDVTNRNSSTVRYIKNGTIYGSNDNSQYTEIATFTNTVTTQLGQWHIDLSANKNYYKYYKLSMVGDTYCSANEINITAKYKSGVYKNPNGHMFYDIADKDIIDTFFDTMGSAWFYGVDTANERIFLPRNNYFDQATGDVSEVGQSVEAGLPNITGSPILGENNYSSVPTPTGAIYKAHAGNAYAGSGDGDNDYLAFDASLSNPIYGNSDTVQPPAVKKLLYICVGNTESVSTITDVVDVTTTENDTTPLFTAQYFDFTPNNPSWLIAGGQANSGGIYTTCYNELVNVLNGETKYGDLKVIDVTDMIVGVDYSEYWKVDQDAMTFTTPTAISNKALSGAVAGNGISLGVTDGTQNASIARGTGSVTALGLFTDSYGEVVGTTSSTATTATGKSIGLTTDATKSGIIAEESTSQLYFKVANAVQNLELLDVGRVMEQAVLKSNMSEVPVIIEAYQNGTSWYRIWSDGWCEQGGSISSPTTVTYIKPMVDTNYNINFAITGTLVEKNSPVITGKTTTGFTMSSDSRFGINWTVRGYIA